MTAGTYGDGTHNDVLVITGSQLTKEGRCPTLQTSRSTTAQGFTSC